MAEFYAILPSNCILPCCNTAANYVSMDCRTRGGVASLCGYPEYVTPGTPPAYYLVRTLSGALVQRHWTSGNCTTGLDCSESFTYSGACSYDANTCVLTTGGNRTESGSGVACVPGSVATCVVGFNAALHDYEILTPMVRTVANDGGFCFSSGASLMRSACSCAESLSSPDTDDNAISRLEAVAAFSAWGAAGAPGCTANYESRTANTFHFQDAQYRANVNLANSTSYTLRAEVWRAPYGFTNYALYSYQMTPFTTNATGFASIVATVPNTKGYTTYVANTIPF